MADGLQRVDDPTTQPEPSYSRRELFRKLRPDWLLRRLSRPRRDATGREGPTPGPRDEAAAGRPIRPRRSPKATGGPTRPTGPPRPHRSNDTPTLVRFPASAGSPGPNPLHKPCPRGIIAAGGSAVAVRRGATDRQRGRPRAGVSWFRRASHGQNPFEPRRHGYVSGDGIRRLRILAVSGAQGSRYCSGSADPRRRSDRSRVVLAAFGQRLNDYSRFREKPTGRGNEYEPSQTRGMEVRLHARRAAGGDRHHRDSHRAIAAGGAGRSGGRAPGPVHESPEAGRPGAAQPPRHVQALPARDVQLPGQHVPHAATLRQHAGPAVLDARHATVPGAGAAVPAISGVHEDQRQRIGFSGVGHGNPHPDVPLGPHRAQATHLLGRDRHAHARFFGQHGRLCRKRVLQRRPEQR